MFVFVACAAAGLVPEISSSVMTQIMFSASREFQAPPSALQMMISVSKLMFAALVLTGGRLGDLYGRRKMLLIGTAGIGSAALACAGSPSIELLVVARALDGVFSALVTPLALALVVFSAEEKERPAVIGMYISIMGIAALSIPYLAGSLLELVHWRVVFLVTAVFAMVGILLMWRLVSSEPISKSGARLDFPGSILCAIGLTSFVYGLIQSNPLGWNSPVVWFCVLGGLLILVLFVFWELRASQPLIDFKLFQNRTFSIAIMAGMVIPFVGAGLYVPFLSYFRLLRESSPSTAALLVMPLPLAAALLSPVAGKLARNGSPRALMSLGLLLMATGAFTLGWIRVDTPYVMLVIPMLLIGGGTAFALTSRTSVVMSSVTPDFSGAASGINTASGKLGSALGTALLSTIFIGIGRNNYLERMSSTNLSMDQIREATLAWRAARNSSALDTLDLPDHLVSQIESSFKSAFAYGLGRTEWIASLLLFGSAALVWFVLKSRADRPLA